MARTATSRAVAFPRNVASKVPLYLGSIRIWESLYAMPFAYIGMVLAADPGGEDIYLLSPDSGAKPGQRVK